MLEIPPPHFRPIPAHLLSGGMVTGFYSKFEHITITKSIPYDPETHKHDLYLRDGNYLRCSAMPYCTYSVVGSSLIF